MGYVGQSSARLVVYLSPTSARTRVLAHVFLINKPNFIDNQDRSIKKMMSCVSNVHFRRRFTRSGVGMVGNCQKCPTLLPNAKMPRAGTWLAWKLEEW